MKIMPSYLITSNNLRDFLVILMVTCPIPRYNTQTNTPSNQAHTKGVSFEILAYYNDLLTRGRLTDDITSSCHREQLIKYAKRLKKTKTLLAPQNKRLCIASQKRRYSNGVIEKYLKTLRMVRENLRSLLQI